MITSNQDTFLSWLRDAYALEVKLVPELRQHAEQAADHPIVQSRIQQHIAETEQHAAKVRQIIESLGGDVSTVKALAGQAMGWVMGASTAMVKDTVVKNALAEFTMEHTEIASYTSLIAAAEHLGLVDAVPVLRSILEEEEAMANWLRMQISVVTLEFLREKAPSGALA